MLAYFLNGNDKDFVSSIISAKEAKELIDNAIKLLNAPLDEHTTRARNISAAISSQRWGIKR
ncbi:hypothetical protein [Campylobacter fetus]|uniref:hypothetical protein n=1 Tax=Campylobacter fetus TaxID=196 RepID=UPI00288D10A3|nr:hypothetical protein [Campylobacter fetus subsp. venerealis]